MAIYSCLQNQHIFVTGGANGIGKAIVEAFHAQGAVVSFIDIHVEASEALVAQLGERVHFYLADLRDIDGLQETIHRAAKNHGAIGCLINNAARDTRYTVDAVTEEIWDEMQEINIRPIFFAAQAVRQMMKNLGGGAIINFTSSSFVKRSPKLTVYGSAKAGIIGLTRTLSRELGVDGIRVNAIMPGWVMTERQRALWLTKETEKEIMQTQSLKEFLQPAEVAKLALFLASSDSKMISAQTYVIDGGWV